MSRYDVTTTNVNRLVTFKVNGGAANTFDILRGNSAYYPHAGTNNLPTVNQSIAQARLNAVVQGLSVYSVVAAVELDATKQYAFVSFEADRQGEYALSAPAIVATATSAAVPAGGFVKSTDLIPVVFVNNTAAPITPTGLFTALTLAGNGLTAFVAGGTLTLNDIVTATGTKPGLQTITNTVRAVSTLDKGATMLFGANPKLADGTASTALAVLTLPIVQAVLA